MRAIVAIQEHDRDSLLGLSQATHVPELVATTLQKMSFRKHGLHIREAVDAGLAQSGGRSSLRPA